MIGVTKFRMRQLKTFMLYGFLPTRMPVAKAVQRREIPLRLVTPDHTVPYGTVLSRDAFPGTSCQATIGVVPTGRAFRHFATASPRKSRSFRNQTNRTN